MGRKIKKAQTFELFPQVDARLLKAAAIEHSKDPDGAVDFILTEVVPYKMEKTDATSAVNRTLGSSVKCERQFSSASSSSTKHDSTAACEDAVGSEVMKAPHYIDPPCLKERIQDPLGSTFYDAKDFNDQLSGYAGSEELTLSKTWEKPHQNTSVFPIMGEFDDGDCSREPKNNSFGKTSELQKYRDLDLSTLSLPALSTSAILKDGVSDISLNKSSDNAGIDCEPLLVGSTIIAHTESQKKKPSFESGLFYGPNHVEMVLLAAKDHTLESLNCSNQSKVGNVKSDPKLEISESCIQEISFREDIQLLGNANTEESSGLNSIVTQPGQVCNTDALEKIIEESKGHQKRLLSETISVLDLMKEVDYKENAAEQAKKEAGERGMEICARVDELKSMLNRAKEANDMHSGEVYGERAILATEMKELQSRLLAMSDLKENSVSILGMMRQTLEAQLAAAEIERIAAEQEAHGREESDRNALAELELIMEGVVQESKTLQQEAEENAKLREFLMDRGRVVDMLQGEISVICQDVKLLEEKLNGRLPLSQSFASSGSSQKSSESEKLLKHDMSSTLSAEPILLLPSAEQTTAFAQNELLDEGWELFEDAAQD
ncbi:hypothetical protein V2J09_016181 [Rumex salicifolius]